LQNISTINTLLEIHWEIVTSIFKEGHSIRLKLLFKYIFVSNRVRFPTGLGIFLFTTVSRTALGPTQPPIEWVPGAPSLG
jgi:hypothetical protein